MNKNSAPMPIILVLAGTLIAAPGWAQTPVPSRAVNPPHFYPIEIDKSPVWFNQVPPVKAADRNQYQFTKIRINHYDAGVIADLMTRPDGIIAVPPNFVIPANAVVPAAAGAAAATPPKAASNVLPEGVRRIFVLESDNSLVIEATPDGLAALSL